MNKSVLIVVTDDPGTVHKAQSFGYTLGAQVEVYTHAQWTEKNKPAQLPSLSGGHGAYDPSRVLNFPGSVTVVGGSADGSDNKSVQSINDLEARAIENAISAFRGNLTEAARALGIGRATLYRKVKQYNIDPSQARKKRVA